MEPCAGGSRVFFQIVLLLSLVSEAILQSPYLAADLQCPCEKGEKGERGCTLYRARLKGTKGDPGLPGSPGQCHHGCSNQLQICGDILQVFGYQQPDSSGSTRRRRRARDKTESIGPVLTQLKEGRLGVSDLNRDQALDVLYSICFIATTRTGTDSSRTSSSGPRVETEKGAKGEKGDFGVGTQGEIGLPGDPGLKGEKGDPGFQGSTGPKGEKGEKRHWGDMGPVGNTGIPGSSGPAGPTGFRGIPGQPGSKGVQGLTGGRGNEGLTYVRWGDPSCPLQSELLHTGLAVSLSNNLLCIPEKVKPSQHSNLGYVPKPHISKLLPLRYTNSQGYVSYMPCALCYVNDRATKFVNLGSDSCPAGWKQEYHGNIVTLHSLYESEMVCLTSTVAGKIQWQKDRQSLVNDLNIVEVSCPSQAKDCHSYGQTLTCSVCTK